MAMLQGVIHIEQSCHAKLGTFSKVGVSLQIDTFRLIIRDRNIGFIIGAESNNSGGGVYGIADLLSMVRIYVYAGRATLGKKSQLGFEIIIEIAVFNRAYMILGHVEIAAHIENHACRPVIFQGLAGHFHGKEFPAAVHRVAEMPVEHDGFRRGEMGFLEMTQSSNMPDGMAQETFGSGQ